MADCHRALGHPEQALKLAKSPSVANFAPAAKAEMTLVEAGARRDMGQLDAALRTLELAPLQSKSREPWVVRLRYAYADTLEAAGRENDALAWFHRTHAVDSDEITDAADRAERWSAAGLTADAGPRSGVSRWCSRVPSVTMAPQLHHVSLRVTSSHVRDRWGRRSSTPGMKETTVTARLHPAPTATRGVLFVHSAPSALCPHIEWAVGGVLGVAVNLDVDPAARPGRHLPRRAVVGR